MANDNLRCLLIHPEFRSRSFWNYRATCDLVGARYPASPLGLITVAALLPTSWECRLVDLNVEELLDADIDWADIVMLGGMIAQQTSALALIAQLKVRGKTVVVGGPDATSSPHLYRDADHLVLGEAELTLPRWLEDFHTGRMRPVYEPAREFADVRSSPIPRFDLLKFDRYLHVGVQFARGCPFLCEFCDIIELFGRVPRLKSGRQMLAELERLYALGYRGHVDFVDDNFIGNRREVKKFLPELRGWLEAHGWPFEFTTEASINIADDTALLEMMQAASFSAIFVGIESPDEETLKNTQKKQNTRRSLAASMRKIYDYGIFVNTGYIVGFDGERDGVAAEMVALIEDSAVPVNMVGLLFALPGTQLARRLASEGRLERGFEVAPEDVGDQCTSGLNFATTRSKADILRDFRQVMEATYDARNYFRRVRELGSVLDCSKRRLRLPLRHALRELRGFARLVWEMGVKKRYRLAFWRSLGYVATRNRRALRPVVALMALYLHFGEFKKHVISRLDRQIAREIRRGDVSCEPAR